MKTLKSVQAADEVVKKEGRSDRQGKKKQEMVYLIEIRVPIENVSEFENESLESVNEYASHRIIDKGVVAAE